MINQLSIESGATPNRCTYSVHTIFFFAGSRFLTLYSIGNPIKHRVGGLHLLGAPVWRRLLSNLFSPLCFFFSLTGWNQVAYVLSSEALLQVMSSYTYAHTQATPTASC